MADLNRVLAYLSETDKLLGLPAGTSARQVGVESNFDAAAVSPKGARGLAQVMPATASAWSKRVGRDLDPHDPEDAVLMHRLTMQENLQRFGNLPDALRAYNGGWDRSKWGNAETSAYAPKVLGRGGEEDGGIPADTVSAVHDFLGVRAPAGRRERAAPAAGPNPLDLINAYYEQQQSAAPAAAEEARDGASDSTARRLLGDPALALGQGVVGGVKMLSDLAGPDNPVSRTLGEAREGLQSLYTRGRQQEMEARNRAIEEADASGSTLDQITSRVGGLVEAPVQTLLQAAGTMAPTIGAALATGGASAVGPVAAVVRGAAPFVVGGGMGVGSVKGGSYDAVYNESIKAGASEEEAREAAIRASEYSRENALQQTAGGALGALAGGTGIERLIGGGRTAGGLMARAARGFGKEAPLEGAQGAQGQYAENEAVIRAGFDRDPMAGVVGSFVGEGLVGGVLGSGAGMATPARRRTEEVDRAIGDIGRSQTVPEAIEAFERAHANMTPQAPTSPVDGDGAMERLRILTEQEDAAAASSMQAPASAPASAPGSLMAAAEAAQAPTAAPDLPPVHELVNPTRAQLGADDSELLAALLERKLATKGAIQWTDIPVDFANRIGSGEARSLNMAMAADPQGVVATLYGTPVSPPETPPPVSEVSGETSPPVSGEPAATVRDDPLAFPQRLEALRETLKNTRVRQQIREVLGPQGLNDITYYASTADNANLPGKTSDNMLRMAEAMLARAQIQPVQPQEDGATTAPARSAARQEAPPAPDLPRLELDRTPTGVMRVDAAGQAAPETRADVISLGDRARAMRERRDGLTAQAPESARAESVTAPGGTDVGSAVLVGDGTLTAATWVDVKRDLGLPRNATRADVVETARAAGVRQIAYTSPQGEAQVLDVPPVRSPVFGALEGSLAARAESRRVPSRDSVVLSSRDGVAGDVGAVATGSLRDRAVAMKTRGAAANPDANQGATLSDRPDTLSDQGSNPVSSPAKPVRSAETGDANPVSRAERPAELIELRKRASVLKSLLECLG